MFQTFQMKHISFLRFSAASPKAARRNGFGQPQTVLLSPLPPKTAAAETHEETGL